MSLIAPGVAEVAAAGGWTVVLGPLALLAVAAVFAVFAFLVYGALTELRAGGPLAEEWADGERPRPAPRSDAPVADRRALRLVA